jgi:predicted RNase H-like HicB family nuclease
MKTREGVGPHFLKWCGWKVGVRLEAEQGGGHSATIPSLPGCGSQGETEEEAMRNVREAFDAVTDAYNEDGGPIPWNCAARNAMEIE